MKTIISFDIVPNDSTQLFSIVRYIAVRGGDPDDHSILKPSAPCKKKEMMKRNTFNNPERIPKDGMEKKKAEVNVLRVYLDLEFQITYRH